MYVIKKLEKKILSVRLEITENHKSKVGQPMPVVQGPLIHFLIHCILGIPSLTKLNVEFHHFQSGQI